jgi:hypothetical protein
MRGRNRNKGPNPLTRTYESNGPDVKIRGTAQHIADKYAQLARDAQASGDPVAAENYLQHAEHYYRIIATAQEQYRDQFGAPFQRPFDDDGEEDTGVNGHAYAPGGMGGGDGDPALQPQPYDARTDNGDRGERQPRFDRGERQERGDRPDRFNRQDRGDRGERRFPRADRSERQDFQRAEPRQEFNRDRPERRRDEDEQPNGLPAFLTTPVRAPINVAEGGEETERTPAEFSADDAGGEPNGRYGMRSRRRRRSRYGNGPGEEGAAEAGPDLAPEGAEPSGE